VTRRVHGRPPTDDELEALAQDRADEIDIDDEAGDRYADEIYRND